MLKKILGWTGWVLLAIVALAAVAYNMRGDPVAVIAGRQLSGEVVTARVDDWTFTDEYQTIAVETRPAAPHSVTTICFTHEGRLYVPASNGSAKSWTHYAVADPRVRIKVGDKVYPARATRVTDASLTETLTAAARAKYDFPAPADGGPQLSDVWVFRMDSAPSGDGAAS